MTRKPPKRPTTNFVCIIGVDGSGKSTLAHYLVKELEDSGFKATYVYGRFQPLLLKPAIAGARLLMLRSKGPWARPDTARKRKTALMKTPILSGLYNLAVYMDYWLRLTFKIRIPLLMGKVVVCDRYVHDTIVTDIGPERNYDTTQVIHSIGSWLRVVPKPGLTILLDVTEEVAFDRKDDVPSLDYLVPLRKMYLEVAKRYQIIVLNGSNSLNELHSEIEREIFP